jgi:hypothetical protein
MNLISTSHCYQVLKFIHIFRVPCVRYVFTKFAYSPTTMKYIQRKPLETYITKVTEVIRKLNK